MGEGVTGGRLVNRFRYPVIRVEPTGASEVADHLTLADALHDAALRDTAGEPAVWHYVDEPGSARDHARQH